MMQIECWVIYSENSRKNHAYSWMESEANKLGIKTTLIYDNQLYTYNLNGKTSIAFRDNSPLTLPKYALIRCYNPQLHKALENCNIRVINSYNSMFVAQNKLKTYHALQKSNISTPFSTEITKNESYSSLCRLFNNTKFVLKASKGMKGEQVWLIESQEQYNATLKDGKGEYLAQKYIETSHGRDVRVWVIGGKAIACASRENQNKLCSNLAQGGEAKPLELTEQIASIAENGCNAIGIEVAGVDLLYLKEGYTVCEINGNCGFRSAPKECNIPKSIFEYLLQIEHHGNQHFTTEHLNK